MPAAVSLAIEKRRNYGLDGEEKGADKSFTTVSSKDQRLGTSENCNGDENNGKEDQKLELASKRRHRSSTETAIERTTAKLSKACYVILPQNLFQSLVYFPKHVNLLQPYRH